jgi:hypothetical protein
MSLTKLDHPWRQSHAVGQTTFSTLNFRLEGNKCTEFRATDLLVRVHARKASVAGVSAVSFGGIGGVAAAAGMTTLGGDSTDLVLGSFLAWHEQAILHSRNRKLMRDMAIAVTHRLAKFPGFEFPDIFFNLVGDSVSAESSSRWIEM